MGRVSDCTSTAGERKAQLAEQNRIGTTATYMQMGEGVAGGLGALWPSITKGLSLEDGQASEMHGASNTHSVINDNNNTGEVDEGISIQCHAGKWLPMSKNAMAELHGLWNGAR